MKLIPRGGRCIWYENGIFYLERKIIDVYIFETEMWFYGRKVLVVICFRRTSEPYFSWKIPIMRCKGVSSWWIKWTFLNKIIRKKPDIQISLSNQVHQILTIFLPDENLNTVKFMQNNPPANPPYLRPVFLFFEYQTASIPPN